MPKAYLLDSTLSFGVSELSCYDSKPTYHRLTEMVSSKSFANVAGVGPGTERSVAVRFSEYYPVILLAALRPESYDDVVAQIHNTGGRAIGITADVTNESASLRCWNP